MEGVSKGYMVMNVVSQPMEITAEEGDLCSHNGLTTCTPSSFRGHTPTPMPMPMSMPTTTSASITTSTRYRLSGTLTASLPPIITYLITIAISTIITLISITAITTIITTITTITIMRFQNILINLEISIIETPVLVCKVIDMARNFCTLCHCSHAAPYCLLEETVFCFNKLDCCSCSLNLNQS